MRKIFISDVFCMLFGFSKCLLLADKSESSQLIESIDAVIADCQQHESSQRHFSQLIIKFVFFLLRERNKFHYLHHLLTIMSIKLYLSAFLFLMHVKLA
jgi:hypothetical protein